MAEVDPALMHAADSHYTISDFVKGKSNGHRLLLIMKGLSLDAVSEQSIAETPQRQW